MRQIPIAIAAALTIPLLGSLVPEAADAMPLTIDTRAAIQEAELGNQLVHYRRYAYYPAYVYLPYPGFHHHHHHHDHQHHHWFYHGYFSDFHGGFGHGGFGHGVHHGHHSDHW